MRNIAEVTASAPPRLFAGRGLRNRVLLAWLPAWALLAGCSSLSGGAFSASREQAPPSGPRGSEYIRATAVKTDGADEGEALDDVQTLSKKYRQAIEKLVRLQEENQTLSEQNRTLAERVASLQAENTQYRKELSEANALLIEMRGELEKWKNNVLGFREEMRKAQRAQLEALAKVLTILGAEVSVPTTQPAGGEVVGARDAADATRQ